MAPKDLFLPAELVHSGADLPPVCTRHGQPAVLRRRAAFQSRTPGWTYALLLVGVLPFAIVSMALRKQLACPAWPLCAQCSEKIKITKRISLGLIVATFAALAGAIALAGHSSTSVALLLLLAFMLFVASLVAFTLAGPGWIARAEVTRDGSALRLREVSPGFVAALPATPPPTWAPTPDSPPQGW